MNVTELIEILSQMDGEADVGLFIDILEDGVIFTVRGTQEEAVIWESQTFSKGLLQRLIICVFIDFVLVR